MANDLSQRPELKWIKLSQLYVPSEYQRPAKNSTSLTNINYIKQNFNWASCGALIVCELNNAKPPQYAIIDGQHRFRAAEAHGKITELPCLVVSPREAQEQAKHFVEVNSKRVKLHTLHAYRAAVVAGQADAVCVSELLKKAKIVIPDNPMNHKMMPPRHTNAVGTLHKMLESYSEKQIIWALTIIGATMCAATHGKGNTVIWLTHRKELLEQTSKTFMRVGLPHTFIAAGKHYNPRLRACIATVGTLGKRLSEIQPPTLLITDECFPSDTLVDGVPIEHITKGSFVRSYNHIARQVEDRPVIDTMTREYKGEWYKITANSGRTFVCTENHPVYIENIGYVAAKCLHQHVHSAIVELDVAQLSTMPKANNGATKTPQSPVQILRASLLRRLQKTKFCKSATTDNALQNMPPRSPLSDSKTLHGLKTTRMGILRRWVSQKAPTSNQLHDYDTNQSQISNHYFGENANEQPDAISQNETENDTQNEGPHIPCTRWKWATHKTAASVARTFWFTNGASHHPKGCSRLLRVCTKLLQSRSRCNRGEACNRGRWPNPPTGKMEIPGQMQDRNTRLSRLEGVEVYKRGSGPRPTWVPKTDSVYNLHVEGNNNYFAEGILVHNCHHSATATD